MSLTSNRSTYRVSRLKAHLQEPVNNPHSTIHLNPLPPPSSGQSSLDSSSLTVNPSPLNQYYKNALRIVVTGAAGQIGYSLIPLIASGQMFGPSQPIILHLMDIEKMENILKAIMMELEDGAYALLQHVTTTTNIQVAFKDVDVALLVGSYPRSNAMERKMLLDKNASIFKAQGEALEKYASPNVHVLVIGNPANTNCAIVAACAPSLPSENFSALTRLDMNRARSHIAKLLTTKLNKFISSDQVQNIIIWGNHSSTQFPDVSQSVVYISDHQIGGLSPQSVLSILEAEQQYLNGPFIDLVQNRGAEIIRTRGSSSAMSAARAICDHMHDWFMGSKDRQIISMAVPNPGLYGIPSKLVFSFPVRCLGNWKYEIVQGIKWHSLAKEKIVLTTKELIEEQQTALESLNIKF